MALFSVDEMSQEWGLQAPFCGSAICAAPALLCTANGTRGGGWRVQRLGWEAECSPPGLLSGMIIKIGIPIDIGIIQKNGIMNKIGILNICISSTRQRGLCMIVSHLKTWSQPTAAHSGKFHRTNSGWSNFSRPENSWYSLCECHWHVLAHIISHAGCINHLPICGRDGPITFSGTWVVCRWKMSSDCFALLAQQHW